MIPSTCRGCGKANLSVFLDLGNMPLAGGFLSGFDVIAGEKTYPLPVHVCNDCGLVQIVEPVDPEVLFKDYSFKSSTVKPLVAHFIDYAAWIQKRFEPQTVVEFGCNDGILIKPLDKLRISAVGIDVSENITEMARSEGMDVVTGYFGVDIAHQLRERLGQVDLITGSNAFAHNDRPDLILEGAKILLKPDGVFCVEVMYAGDLLELFQWDTLYHEHLTFYSLGTLSKLLNRYGFNVIHAEKIPMHGGSLRVAATCMTGIETSAEMRQVQDYEERLKINTPETWSNFGDHVQRKIDIVRETLTSLSKTSRIWGYGAAGKATLWVNTCKLNFIEAMVDASPLRAGKLMPGTHTPIVFPEELKKNPPDYIFVTAWNYVDIISKNESWYNGIWVTPLPDLRMF